MRLVFLNSDNTKMFFTVPVTSGDYAQWEQFSNTFIAPKDYTRINVSLMFTKPSGTLWWEDISLLQGP